MRSYSIIKLINIHLFKSCRHYLIYFNQDFISVILAYLKLIYGYRHYLLYKLVILY